MPYQNNNNRITPNPVQGLIKITPTAQITDQLIRPQVLLKEQQEIAERQHLANSLANIGKGLGEVETAFKQSGEAIAGELILQDEIDKNTQHNYKEAAKDLPFLSRINPYVQRGYNELAVQDWAQSIKNGFLADPNLNALEPETFNAKLNTAMQELKDRCRENNIPTSIAGKEMSKFYTEMNDIRGKYVINHEVYKTELGYNRLAQKVSHQMYAAVIAGKKDEQYSNISAILNSAVQDNLSVPEKDLFEKIVIPAISSMVKNLDSDEYLDEEQLIRAVAEFNVNGMNAETFDLEYKAKIKETIRAARRQKIQDKIDEDKELKRIKEDKKEAITKEYFKKDLNNEFKTTKEAQKYIEQRAGEEGIEEELPGLLGTIIQYDKLSQATSDITPEESEKTLNTLDNLMVQRKLTLSVLNQYSKYLTPEQHRIYAHAIMSEENRQADIIRQEQNFNKQLYHQDITYARNNAQASLANLKSVYVTDTNKRKQLEGKPIVDNGKVTNLWTKYKKYETALNSMIAAAQSPQEFARVQRAAEEAALDLQRELDSKPITLPKIRQTNNLYTNERASWRPSLIYQDGEKASKIFTESAIIGRGNEVKVKNDINVGDVPVYELDIPYNTSLRVPRGSGGATLINAGYSPESGYFMELRLNNSQAVMRVENMKPFNAEAEAKRIQRGVNTTYFPNQVFGVAGENVRMGFEKKTGNEWTYVDKALGSIDSKGKYKPIQKK